MGDGTIQKANEAFKVFVKANKMEYDAWVHGVVFTWQWWLEVALIISMPLIWWFFIRKKESTDRLLYAGLFIIVISTYLDNFGSALGLWSYPIKVIPIIPPYLPWDTIYFPFFTMVFLQYKPKFSPLIKAIVFSAIGSFVVEPLATWAGRYNPMFWKHWYTFIFLIAIYLMAHYMASRDNFKKL